MSRSVALARDARIAAAAAHVMPRGNAVDALVAGVIAAAAVSPIVLLGPLQVIVAGPGVGIRAVDGRCRQPGLGVPRPRGFVSRKEIADAAYVAAPGLPSALAALLASFGSMTLRRVARPGLELAPPARKAVLTRFADQGPSAFVGSDLGDELVSAAGRLAGGVLTKADLAKIVPEIRACRKDGRPPWAADAEPSQLLTDVLVVADSRGIVAAACFASSEAEVAVTVASLGLEAPRLAEPVMRGVRRASPGSVLSSPAPIAVADGMAIGAYGPHAEDELEDALTVLHETGSLPRSATVMVAVTSSK